VGIRGTTDLKFAKIRCSTYNSVMKWLIIKYVVYACIWCVLRGLFIPASFALEWIFNVDATKIFTKDSNEVIDTTKIQWNPIRAWANTVIWESDIDGSVAWVVVINSDNHQQTLTAITSRIQKITDRALGILAFCCIIYLVYTGIRMLLSASDDKAQEQWMQSIITIVWVLWWIGSSWLIVAITLYIVRMFA